MYFGSSVRVRLYMAARLPEHDIRTPGKDGRGIPSAAKLDSILREKDRIDEEHSLQPKLVVGKAEEESERRRPKKTNINIEKPQGRGSNARAS